MEGGRRHEAGEEPIGSGTLHVHLIAALCAELAGLPHAIMGCHSAAPPRTTQSESFAQKILVKKMRVLTTERRLGCIWRVTRRPDV